MRNRRVLLDANVLVDAQLRDVFLCCADAELFDLRWSAAILNEARRALGKRSLTASSDAADRVCAAIATAFATDEVTGYEHLIADLDHSCTV